MRTALGEGNDMVDLFSWRQFTAFFTKLTKWVGGNIPVAYTHPGTAVSFLGSRVSLVTVIPFVLFLGMLLTKLTIGQPRTARMRARTLWFAGHGKTSLHEKSAGRLLC